MKFSEIWSKAGKAIRHNQGLTIALLLAGGLALYVVGCESTTQSIKYPELKVTRAEFQLEVESEVKRLRVLADKGNMDLDRQDRFKAALVQLGMSVAKGEAVNPVGMTTAILVSLGLLVDNRKKDGLIKGKAM